MIVLSTDISTEFQSRDWNYTLYPIDCESDQFGPFAEIVTLIRSRIKPGAVMASWADLDFYDFSGWHSAICLKQLLPDTNDFKVRLFGTFFVKCFEEDMTGILLSKQPSQDDQSISRTLLYYNKVCETPGIGIHYGAATWIKKQYKHFTLLGFPLADDGLNATHALSFIIESSPEAPLQKKNP